jgi:hypothetical protein
MAVHGFSQSLPDDNRPQIRPAVLELDNCGNQTCQPDSQTELCKTLRWFYGSSTCDLAEDARMARLSPMGEGEGTEAMTCLLARMNNRLKNPGAARGTLGTWARFNSPKLHVSWSFPWL